MEQETSSDPKKEWLLADAKNKLSELVNYALHTPQFIRRRGDRVVVLSQAEYERLTEKRSRNFIQHLLNIPRSEDETEFTRDPSLPRPVDFS